MIQLRTANLVFRSILTRRRRSRVITPNTAWIAASLSLAPNNPSSSKLPLSLSVLPIPDVALGLLCYGDPVRSTILCYCGNDYRWILRLAFADTPLQRRQCSTAGKLLSIPWRRFLLLSSPGRTRKSTAENRAFCRPKEDVTIQNVRERERALESAEKGIPLILESRLLSSSIQRFADIAIPALFEAIIFEISCQSAFAQCP